MGKKDHNFMNSCMGSDIKQYLDPDIAVELGWTW